MNDNKNIELTLDQLGEAAGGIWDEENNFTYFEGTVTDMGGRTAFVRIDCIGEKECTYDRRLVYDHNLSINSRVRVRWPEKVIYMVI
ncbi:MAG: hypothetical protein IKF16_12565 [Lachnospiraceae bacterium]|nr:hypothetical protein [Lachnospiraceae bacterium]